MVVLLLHDDTNLRDARPKIAFVCCHAMTVAKACLLGPEEMLVARDDNLHKAQEGL
jgi:hypothetical protein